MISNDSRRRKIVYITSFSVSGWLVDLDRTISPGLTVIKEHHRSAVRPRSDRLKEQFSGGQTGQTGSDRLKEQAL